MSQRLKRKEIKRDEFANAVGRSFEYAESHSRGFLWALVGVVGAVAVGLVVYWLLGYRSERANEALYQAIKVYQAPIDPAAPKPADPRQPSFADESSRRARALELFKAVQQEHRFTGAADVAAVYIAGIDAVQGKLAEARQLWSDFVKKHGGDILASEARLNVIALDLKTGKGQAVVQQLRAMLDQADSPLPQDVVLYQLGTALEKLDRGSEAVQSYQRILDEYPQSPYRQEAQQRVTALDPARAGGAGGGFPGLGGGMGGFGGGRGFPG